ncbi:hypothetical protein BH10PSE19_BH10PSE19_02920 [soil metagenome]
MKLILNEMDYNTLSHELRIPLAGILGMSELLSKEEGLTVKQKEEVAIIHIAGIRLFKMIKKILDCPREVDGRN